MKKLTTILMSVVMAIYLPGCCHIPDSATSPQGVPDDSSAGPAEDISLYHDLVNLVLRHHLIRKDGSPRYAGPVLLLLPNKFKPGYVPSVPGIEVVIGESSDPANYKTVIAIQTFKQTQYGFAVDVVINHHVSLGASGSCYSLEKTVNGWRCGPPKEKERPLAWKS
jgi:hypothetical protein